jgi:hypothetical protein
VAADARNQIYRVHKVYEKCLARNPKAKMAIGIDANPKDEREMTALERVVEGLHLIMSKVGATTIKKRKVTPQHEKTNKLDNHPKDAIIVSPGFKIIRQTVGYAPSLPPETRLPNKVIVSDHAPVGMHVTSADAGG